MSLSPRRLVPMAFVASVPRAVDYYRQLGFVLDNEFQPPGTKELTWAYLCAGEAQLMVAKATAPVVASEQAVLFYLYVDDVDAAHKSLAEAGIQVGPIKCPPHAPKGEFRIADPDGYVVMITHV